MKGTHKWRISLLCVTTVFCCVHDNKLLDSWIQDIFGQTSFNITQPHPPTQGPSRETAFCYFFLLLFKPINDHKFSVETDWLCDVSWNYISSITNNTDHHREVLFLGWHYIAVSGYPSIRPRQKKHARAAMVQQKQPHWFTKGSFRVQPIRINNRIRTGKFLSIPICKYDLGGWTSIGILSCSDFLGLKNSWALFQKTDLTFGSMTKISVDHCLTVCG